MSYKIVVDSGCDLPQRLREDEHFVVVPLTLSVGGVDIVDDDSFNQKDFLKRVSESKECPKSACPSPERYLSEYESAAGDVYVITLSGRLSGSYNSALVAADMYEEDGGSNHVHVFDSLSGCCGEAVIAMKIVECVEQGMGFDEVVKTVSQFRDGMKTYFVLETLETLRKNGRLTNLQAILANVLSIKPVMSAREGEIIKLEQTRGINKALKRMCEIILENVKEPQNKVLAISHCNCPERAEYVKGLLLDKCRFKDVVIVDTAGVATMYANDGGIVVAV
jgi:DegV family protein with EDD domain